MDFKRLIQLCQKQNASDIHVRDGDAPFLRVDGILRPVDHPPLTTDEMIAIGCASGGKASKTRRMSSCRSVCRSSV